MKKWTRYGIVLMLALGLVGCNSKSMNAIINNKPSVTGIVMEVYDDYVIMFSDFSSGYPNGSKWSISLNPVNKDSDTNLSVGDEIVVYHDGNIMETSPLKVGKVYAITLKNPADRTKNEEP